MRTKFIFLFAAVFIIAQMANATTYYVRSTGGSDSNNGLTALTAFATLTKVFSGTPALNNGDIIDISGTFEYAVNKAITKSITIQGNDRSTAVIYGNTSLINKCFTVNSGVTLTIENVTFRDYYNFTTSTNKEAGVIYLNAGAEMICRKCDFKNNQSTIGGAISINAATMLLEDCYFYDNRAINGSTAAASGGAVNVNNSTTANVTIDRCLFENNTTEGAGAAISFRSQTTATATVFLIRNSTIVGNMQKNGANGGAINLNIQTTSAANVKLINNTIAYNTTQDATTGSRPGLYVAGLEDKVVLINNIISSNTDAQAVPVNRSIVGLKFKETRNNLTDMAYNFVSNTVNAANSTGNQNNVTALSQSLSLSLADNGGLNKSLAIGASSVAKNAGYATDAPAIDQRGIPRSTVDIGAYEYVTYRSKTSGNWSSITSWQSSGNNSTWSDASIVPTQNVAGELSIQNGHEIIVAQAATSPSLTVNPGGKLTINSLSTLGVVGNIALNSDVENGTGTLVNKNVAGGLTVSGSTNVQQYLGSARNWYVSSPVSGANSPANNITRYYEYVEAGNNNYAKVDNVAVNVGETSYWKYWTTGNSMTVGKGYIAQASGETTVQFSGTPNNGDIETEFNLTRDDTKGKGFNLVGNPYPSYLDWSMVYAANQNLMSTAWFKTKKTTEFGGGYTFATVNITPSQAVEIVSNNANTSISKYIPPTQAFWVRVKSETSSTTMNFTNAMREHRINSGDFMKAPKVNERSRLRLQLVNGIESDETLIYFDGNATNDFNEYDSPKMMNNSSVTPDLYTKASIERLVINGMKAITDNMEIPLGFSLNAASSLKLKATEMSNFPLGTHIYLLDKVENTQTELIPETEYSFSTSTATYNNESRFSLIFRASGNATEITNTEKLNTKVFVNAANQITIIAPEKCDYTVYNAVGQKQYENNLNSAKTTINKVFGAGVYFVKLSVNGRSEIQKVVIR